MHPLKRSVLNQSFSLFLRKSTNIAANLSANCNLTAFLVVSGKFIQFCISYALRPQPMQTFSALREQILTQGDFSNSKHLSPVKYQQFCDG